MHKYFLGTLSGWEEDNDNDNAAQATLKFASPSASSLKAEIVGADHHGKLCLIFYLLTLCFYQTTLQ